MWSTLPRDLLSSITERLPTNTDIRHFRAVCTSWRSSTPLPPKSNLKIPSYSITGESNTHFSLTESTIYCIQSLNTKSWFQSLNTKSWFIRLQQHPTQPHKMLLLEPFSKYRIGKLHKGMQKTINLLDYKLTEISTVFDLRFTDSRYFYFEKVVTSSTVVDANFTVFALRVNGRLGVWKMGDETWTEIDWYAVDNTYERPYCDVVFYKGKFFAVNYSGRVLVIDSSFKITEMVFAVGPESSRLHLVVSFGELFLLERCFNEGRESDNGYHSVSWKVYKLNEDKNDWVLVNSLGDRAFFVGRDSSFSVSARDFPGCKGNTIYFNFEDDILFKRRKGDDMGYKGGIYDLEDGSVGPLSAFPGYSEIFWPPPTWLKGNRCSS